MSKSYMMVAVRAAEMTRESGRRKFDREMVMMKLGRPRPRQDKEREVESETIGVEERPATDPSSELRTDQTKEIRSWGRGRRDQISPGRRKALTRYTLNVDRLYDQRNFKIIRSSGGNACPRAAMKQGLACGSRSAFAHLTPGTMNVALLQLPAPILRCHTPHLIRQNTNSLL